MIMYEIIRRLSVSPKKTAFYFVLLSVLFVGIFFRTYHFSDWLHFETDQVDDYFAVSPAIEIGWGKLPLVGPKAAGTDLHLGPIFYIFEFISAKIFGNTPVGHAGATLFFSILSLPLFYITSRLFFSRINSLFLSGIFATSTFLILYSRFSWNPNVLPFFLLLIIFTVTKSVSKASHSRQSFWLFSAVISIAVAMQLHVSAMLVVPAFVIGFFLWKRPYFPVKTWLIALIIFGTMFIPTILYEIATHGQTINALTSKIDIPSEEGSSKATTKIIQNFRYHAGNYFLILTGHDSINSNRPNGSSLGVSCLSCAAEAPYRIAGYVFFALSIFFLIAFIFKEKNEEKKSFLIVVFLWFIFSFFFLFSIMISGKYLYPRFFLLAAPIPIFFFGFFLHSISPERNIFRFCIAFMLTALIIFMNLKTTIEIFSQTKQVTRSETVIVGKEDIFPDTNRMTLEQQEKITDFIAEKARGKNLPVYLKSESEYEPSLWMLLQRNHIAFSGPTLSTDDIYEKGLYFFVFRSASPLTKEMRLYLEKFSVSEEVPFGALTLSILDPKPASITQKIQNEKKTYQKMEDALNIPRLEMLSEYFE